MMLMVRRQAEVMALSDVFLALTVIFFVLVALAPDHAPAANGRRRRRRTLSPATPRRRARRSPEEGEQRRREIAERHQRGADHAEADRAEGQ